MSWPKSKDEEIIEKMLRYISETETSMNEADVESHFIHEYGTTPKKCKLYFKFMADNDLIYSEMLIFASLYKTQDFIPPKSGITYDITPAGQRYIMTPWIMRKIREYKDELLVITAMLSSAIAVISVVATLVLRPH